MRKYLIFILLVFLSFAYSRNLFAKDQCSIKEVINLSVFKKMIINFIITFVTLIMVYT